MGQGEPAVSLHGMTKSVAQIELHPAAGVFFIFHDHIPFQCHTPGNDSFPVKVQAGSFQLGEQFRVIQYAVFDDLCTAVPENVLRKGVQGVQIAQDQTGLVECPCQILTGGKVDGSFSTHGGINRCQQGGGNLNEPDAPEVAGGGETRQITHHTAAQGDDQVAPAETGLGQGIQQLQKGFSVFAFLSGGEYKGGDGISRRFQAGFGSAAIQGIDQSVADQEDLLHFPQVPDGFTKGGQQSVTNADVVGPGGGHGNGFHPSTSSFRFFPSSSNSTSRSKSPSATA